MARTEQVALATDPSGAGVRFRIDLVAVVCPGYDEERKFVLGEHAGYHQLIIYAVEAQGGVPVQSERIRDCLLYTSDAADE